MSISQVQTSSSQMINTVSFTLTTEDPLTLGLYRKKAIDQPEAYTKVHTWETATSGTLTYADDLGAASDTLPPESPIINIDRIKYSPEEKSVRLPIAPSVDVTSAYDYRILNETSQEILSTFTVRSMSGIKEFYIWLSTTSEAPKPTDLAPLAVEANKTEYEVVVPVVDPTVKLWVATTAKDWAGNESEVTKIDIDLSDPPLVGQMRLGGVRLELDKQLLSFPTNSTLDFSASPIESTAKTARRVLYDVALINAKTNDVIFDATGTYNTETASILSIPLTGFRIYGNPKIKKDTLLQFRVTTRNSYWTEGLKSVSRTFTFDTSRPESRIEFLPTSTKSFIDFYNLEKYPVNLSWKVIDPEPNFTYPKYEIQMRTRLSHETEWSNQAWTTISDEVTGTTYKVPSSKLQATGYTVREFRIRGLSEDGDSEWFTKEGYISDIYVINEVINGTFISAVRIPIGTYSFFDKVAKLETTINGNVMESLGTEIRYGEFKTKIGKTKVGLLAPASVPDPSILIDPTRRKNYLLAVLERYNDLYRYNPFNATTYSTHTVDLQAAESDVFLVGSVFPVADLPKEISVTYAPTNGSHYRSEANLTVGSKLIITDKTDSSQVDQRYDFNQVSNLKVYKYTNLPTPTVVFDESPTPKDRFGEVDTYDPPISLSSSVTAPAEHPLVGDESLTVHSSYIVAGSEDAQDVDTYVNGTKIYLPGMYTFTARTLYRTGMVQVEGPEQVVRFYIDPKSNVTISPTVEPPVYEDGRTIFKFNTNITPGLEDRYTYKVTNLTTGKVITPERTLEDGKVVYTFTFTKETTKEGMNLIEISYTKEGVTKTLKTAVNVVESSTPGMPGGFLIINANFHKRVEEAATPYCNDFTGRAEIMSMKNNIIVLHTYGETGDVPLSTRYLAYYQPVSEKDKFRYKAFHYGQLVKDRTAKYTFDVVQQKDLGRTREVDGTKVDRNTLPMEPLVEVTTPYEVAGFTPGSTSFKVLGEASLNITNQGPMYEVIVLCNGKQIALNKPITSVGKNTLLIIFKNTHNYQLSFKRIDIEVLKSDRYTRPLITFSPAKKFEKAYTVDVQWFAFDEERDPDAKLEVKQKSTGNTWVTYGGPLTVTGPDTISARKTIGEHIRLNDEVEFPEEFFRLPAIPQVVFLDQVAVNNVHKAVFIPAVDKHPICRYEWKVNGLPYVEGTPITNYDHSVKEHLIEVTAINRYDETQRITQRMKAIIDTTVPKKPYLLNVQAATSKGRILNLGKDFTVQLDPASSDPNYETSIMLDGQVVREGDKPFDTPTSHNGVHTLVVYSRSKANGMVNFTSYSFEVNAYPTTAKFHTEKAKRFAIVPYDRSNPSYDTPGELVVDSRTGDLSLVLNERSTVAPGYRIADITKELKNQLISLEAQSGRIRKAAQFEEARTFNIEWTNPNLNRVNAELKAEAETILARVKATLERVKGLNQEVGTTAQKVNDFKILVQEAVKTGSDLDLAPLREIQAAYPAKVDKIWEEKSKVERALSDLAISMYNLESIRLIALLKVDKTDFESFRDTREGYYRSLAARIT